MTTDIILIGSGGHAVSITNVAHSCGYTVVNYVDDNKSGETLLETPIISTDECHNLFPKHNFCIAIGDNEVRHRVVDEYKSKLSDAKFPSLIHSSCVIGVASNISEGTVVMPQTNIGPNSTVGNFCIVNTGSSIDHDCILNDYVSIGPGVITGGNVTIGARSAISIGTIVKNDICIGEDVVVGAKSYVNKSLEDNIVAYGTPCKKIRGRVSGDSYLNKENVSD
jgi:sugar O-acyltransferase (sialic acid O-acetyltransferase NeuD family)